MKSLLLAAAVLPLASWTQVSPGTAGRRVGPELLPEPITLTPEGLANLWSFPSDVQRADLDGDGHEDLIVQAITRLVLFRGHGDGRFEAARFLIDTGVQEGFALGDLDRDGLLDVVSIPRSDTPQPALAYRNLGGGSLAAPQPLPVSRVHHADVLLEDVDRDGRLDALLSGQDDATLLVLHGNGDGSFAAPVPVPTAGPNARLESGDLDGDVWPEIVALVDTPAPRLVVHATSPSGLGPGQVVAGDTAPVRAFRVADLDRDRLQDVVYVEQYPGASLVMLVPGATLVPFPLSEAGAGAEVRECADLDGDGRLDLVLLHPERGLVSVMLAQRTGGFASPTELAAGPLVLQGTVSNGPTRPVDVVAVPDEARGVLDLAVLNDGGTRSALTLLRNRGDGHFAAMQRLDAPPGNLRAAAGDLDLDGRVDLAVCRMDGLSLYPGRGDGTFAAPTDLAQAGDLGDVAIADLDGDGLPDLVAARRNPSTSVENGLVTFLGQGGGAFATGVFLPIVNHRTEHLALADFDRDGFLDVVSASDVALRFNPGNGDGTLASSGPTLATGSTIQGLRTGDSDGDGHPEVLVGNGGTLWLVHYDGSSGPVRRSIGTATQEAAFADLDGDGALDIAASRGGPPRKVVFWGRGDGTFQPAQTFAGLFGGTTAADLDGDGRLELVQSWLSRCTLGIQRQIRPRQFLALETYAAGAAVHQIVARDLDGDGLDDLVACSAADARVSVHLNQSSFPSFRNLGAARSSTGGPAPWIRGAGAVQPGRIFEVRLGAAPAGATGVLRLTASRGWQPRALWAERSGRFFEPDPTTLEARVALRVPPDPALAGARFLLSAVYLDRASGAILAHTGRLEALVGASATHPHSSLELAPR